MKQKLLFSLDSSSTGQTINYAEKFSKCLRNQDVVILEGALGGGKTTFTKGVLKGLGYKKRVLSPSFTLVRQYLTKKFLVYHADLYRLNKKEALSLGLEDFVASAGSLTLIEWGKKIKEELKKYILIEFLYSGENSRRLSFSLRGYSPAKNQAIKNIFNKKNLRP